MRPYIQRIANNKQVHLFSLSNFSGGINNRTTQMQEHEASDISNLLFTDLTIMEKRPGVNFHTDFQADSAITYMDKYKPYRGIDKTILATDTQLYLDGISIYNVNSRIQGKNHMGMYFFADGHGIHVLGNHATENNTHTRVIGTKPTEYCVLKLVSPPQGYTPLANPNIVGVYCYNYETSMCWYEPCAYEVEDTFKGENVVPTSCKFVESSQGRLYFSGENEDDDNVFITDLDNGFYNPVFLPIQVPPNSDKITGLKVFHDSVITSRNEDVHVIYGNTTRSDYNSELYSVKRTNSHAGFINNRTIHQVTNYLFYIGSDMNIYSFYTPKTDTDMLMTTMLNTQIDLTKSPFNYTKSQLKNSESIYFNDMWYILINNTILVYSYRHRAWSLLKFREAILTSIAVLDDDIVFGLESGRLAKFTPNSFSDFGQPYECYWVSKNFDMGVPIYDKFFRDFHIVANTYIDLPTTIRVKFDIDYSDVLNDFTAKSRIAVWGTAIFGEKFLSRAINATNRFLVGARGKTIRITFRNGYWLKTSVNSYADLYQILGVQNGELYYVINENKFYLYDNFVFTEQDDSDLFQPMKVFEISGEYEFREVR